MKNNLLLLIFLSSFYFLNAQRTSAPTGKYCYENNINNANINNFTPVTVRVNAVTLHRDDGSGFFKLLGSDQESIDQSTVFMEFLDHVNYVYANFVQPTSYANCGYTGTEFFSDLKVRVKHNILPISDTYYWNYKNSGADIEQNNTTGFTPTETWYIAPLDNMIHNSPNYPKAINSYYTHDADIFDQVVADSAATWPANTKAAGQSPSTTNFSRSSQTHVPNRFLKYLHHKYKATEVYNTTWDETRNWHINDSRGSVGHELGHCFSLGHLNNCANNLMRQRQGSNVDNAQNFLTPIQVRTVHDKLSTTNLIQFVTEDSYYNVGLRITNTQTWNAKRRIYSDLIIENGGSLTLKGDLIMPPQSRIYIRNGGTLILDGGIILSADGENWGGLYQSSLGTFNITLNTNSTELYGNEYFQIIANTGNSTVCLPVAIGGKETEAQEQFLIYPNPSEGIVSIELIDSELIGGEIYIYDSMNKSIFSKNFIFNKEELNLKNLPKGFYTVMVSKNGKNVNKKLIIK